MLHEQLTGVRCPVCSFDNYKLRNIGFIGASWQIKAVLAGVGPQANDANNDIKVVSTGMTYDSKLYIFEELDYK